MYRLKTPISFILILTGALFSEVSAQSKITEKFLIGSWKLVIDVEDELDKAGEEARANDSLFESIILDAVSGAVTGLLDRIDITLDFQKSGRVKVIIDAFGERELEYTEWSIDDKGRLYITETENFKADFSEFWIRDGDQMIFLDDDSDKVKEVYLTRIE